MSINDEERLETKKLKQQIKEDDDLDISDLFEDWDEKKKAKALILKYLSDYTIETISDKNTLKNLIYLEVINTRLQKTLNDAHTANKAIDSRLIKTVHENIEQITELKEKLGITREKQDLNSNNGYGYLQTLKQKYKIWLSENQASRYMVCPHCGKSVLLKVNMQHWEAQKHPFFKDRILGNDHLVELFKQEKLTKLDLAKIFETSEDYVDWLVQRWNISQDHNENRQSNIKNIETKEKKNNSEEKK
jgi:DNA-directed RNA polymerase subunit RPC12/RpoP